MTIYNYNKATSKRTSTAKDKKQIYLLGVIQKPKALQSINKTEEGKLAFQEKLILCTKIYNFNSTDCPNEKQNKTRLLEEVVDYVSSLQTDLNEEIMDCVMDMISTNIFRSFKFTVITKPPQQNGMDFDDEETVVDNGWVHLQFVYELFLKLILLQWFNGKHAEKYFSITFLRQLINNFLSEDTREREFLKTILHRLYAKFMLARPLIKTHIQNIFLLYVYESNDNVPGVGDLLEVYRMPLHRVNYYWLQSPT